VKPAKCLKGEITLPGDKSISHRALILSSIAYGKSVIKGLQKGKDCLATLNSLKLMGVEIEEREDEVIIWGKGHCGLKEPVDVLNCGNSGTTIRLLSGLIAGQNFYSVLSGDKYLRERPMRRVTEPLRRMGSSIFGREKGQFPPLTIVGKKLKGIDYFSPIPSAQIKSCLLLAGLNSEGKTIIREPYLSRDHTERMLKFLGAKIKVNHLTVSLKGRSQFSARDIIIPGDISAASFFIGGATILKDSKIKVLNVGLNPTRRGFIDTLTKMGVDIRIINLKRVCEEEVGDLEVRGENELKGITIKGAMIPRLIDEIPILAVVSCFAQGETIIKDAQELRVKETDRIKAIVKELRKMGANIEEKDDGMIIEGGKGLKGGECRSYGDHRMAMTLAVAGLASEEGVKISDTECIATSFPNFWEILNYVADY